MEFNLETIAMARHQQVGRDARAARRATAARAPRPAEVASAASSPTGTTSTRTTPAPALDGGTVTAQELSTWLASGRRPQLVGVLSAWQFRTAHIPGSQHYDSVEAAFASLSRHDPVVVYCAGDPCPAARWAARLLRARGFGHVVLFPGGLQAWAAAGAPLATGAAGRPL